MRRIMGKISDALKSKAKEKLKQTGTNLIKGNHFDVVFTVGRAGKAKVNEWFLENGYRHTMSQRGGNYVYTICAGLDEDEANDLKNAIRQEFTHAVDKKRHRR
jgi:putative component of toxin-antitoxin plasmid stabilization module